MARLGVVAVQDLAAETVQCLLQQLHLLAEGALRVGELVEEGSVLGCLRTRGRGVLGRRGSRMSTARAGRGLLLLRAEAARGEHEENRGEETGRKRHGSRSLSCGAARGQAGRRHGSPRRLVPPATVQFCAAWPHVSWHHPLEHAGERNRFAHVVEPADPGDAALDAHPEARVWHGAVAAEVDVPVEDAGWQAMGANLLFEDHRIVLALPAADDLAVALGSQHVDRWDRLSCRTPSPRTGSGAP